jgi:hypothetical protein
VNFPPTTTASTLVAAIAIAVEFLWLSVLSGMEFITIIIPSGIY